LCHATPANASTPTGLLSSVLVALKLVAEGSTVVKAANQLGYSERHIKRVLAAARRALGVVDNAAAHRLLGSAKDLVESRTKIDGFAATTFPEGDTIASLVRAVPKA
jgi:methylphosphotriester-DNA--protein-cysteine methyltransferase